ncbi:MAG: hypothetical protein A4S09_03270 [Proteobacteria bacterium SG_bin7]|nr:MAG: hypothetical protein A4S09_03270 [Proteobacteria bacterium SG_bin7]
MRLLAFAATIVLISHYQNCNPSGNSIRFDSTGLPPVNRVNGGSGDGLDGKPRNGDWIRTFPDYHCPTSTSEIQATIKIDNIGATVLTDNCTNPNFSFSPSDPALSFEFYNPDFLVFSGGIFEIKETLTERPHINESLCRFKDSSRGIDVVIQSGLMPQLSAKIVAGFYASRDTASINYSSVKKTVFPSTTEFESADGSFVLTINGTPQEYKNLTGRLTTHIDGTMKDFTVVCQKMSQEPVIAVDTTSLAAYWKFDSPTIIDNGVLADSAGTFPGTIHTSDALNKATPGAFGNAMIFDGSNDYVDIGPNLDMPMNDFSISFWYRPQQSAIARQVWGRRWDLGGKMTGWNLEQFDNTIDPRMSDGTNLITSHFTPVPIDNAFHHVIVAYDRSNGVIRLYIDGSASGTIIDISMVGSVAYSGRFLLGAPSYSQTIANFLGAMDEVSVWTRALNAADAQAIYRNIILY